ncbi:hypothetical protein BDV06DRAFT_220329 [Aspergillus oleicola]
MGLYYDIPAIEHEERLLQTLSMTRQTSPPSPPQSPSSQPQSQSQPLPLLPPVGTPAYGFLKSPLTGHLHRCSGHITHHTSIPALIFVEPIRGMFQDSWRPATEMDILNFQRGRFGGVYGKSVGEEAVGFWCDAGGKVYWGIGRVRMVVGECLVAWVG